MVEGQTDKIVLAGYMCALVDKIFEDDKVASDRFVLDLLSNGDS